MNTLTRRACIFRTGAVALWKGDRSVSHAELTDPSMEQLSRCARYRTQAYWASLGLRSR